MPSSPVDLLRGARSATAPPPGGPTTRPRRDWVVGLVAVGWAAGVGLIGLGAPALLAWLAAGAPGEVGAALRAAVALWLVAHGSGITLSGVAVTLVPLGLTAVPLLLLHRAGRSAAATAGAASPWSVVRTGLPALAAYPAVAAALAALARDAAVGVHSGRAAAAAGAVALLGFGSGLLRGAGLLGAAPRLPATVRRCARAGTVAAAAVVAGGAAAAAATLVGHLGPVNGLLTDLDLGPVGGALTTLAGVALLPNAAVWAAAVSLGPGFAVGTGTAVGVTGTSAGPLPALPVLAALPADVPPLVVGVLLAVPLLAGGLAGWRLHGAPGRPRGRLARCAEAAGAGAVAGGLLGLAAWLSGGAAGSRRLAEIGPVPWEVGAAGAAALSLAAAVTVLGLAWRDARR